MDFLGILRLFYVYDLWVFFRANFRVFFGRFFSQSVC
jgi:hypothetical protein